jgi:hypothetical protein
VNWPLLIVILIPLAVWILTTIFRTAEERNERERAARQPADGGRLRTPRRPQTEMDRFLQEARARRQAPPKPAEQEHPARPAPVLLEALPVARPLERPPAEKPRPRPTERAKPRPPGPAVERAVSKLSVPQPVAPAVPPPQPAAAEFTRAEPAPALQQPVAVVPQTRPRPLPASALRLMELLGNKQNLATAVMLHEVFDRPMCQRRAWRAVSRPADKPTES